MRGDRVLGGKESKSAVHHRPHHHLGDDLICAPHPHVLVLSKSQLSWKRVTAAAAAYLRLQEREYERRCRGKGSSFCR